MGQHHEAVRRRLPPDRDGTTHKFEIRAKRGVIDGYLTVNLYDDGCPGEIFVRMSQMGSQVSGFIDAFAIAVSMLLQTGTTIDIICAKFRGAKFEPSGITDNDAIRFAQSPIDYIARWLEIKFVDAELAVDDDDAEPAFGGTATPQECVVIGCENTEGVALRRGRYVCEHHGAGKA